MRGVLVWIGFVACVSACGKSTSQPRNEDLGMGGDVGVPDATDDSSDIAQTVPRYPGPCTDTITDAGDGSVKALITLTYDDQGRLLTDTFDTGADGEAETLTSRAYDGRGNLARWERDSPIGPPLERAVVYTYDAQDRYVRIERYDGEQLTAETYEWTAEHQVVIRIDSGGDGTVEFSGTQVEEYDADGNLVRRTWDLDSDGTIETELVQQWENGLLVRSETTADVGTNLVVYAYNDQGWLISERSDYESDGIFDAETTYTYDEAGNRLTYTAGDNVVVADYSCW